MLPRGGIRVPRKGKGETSEEERLGLVKPFSAATGVDGVDDGGADEFDDEKYVHGRDEERDDEVVREKTELEMRVRQVERELKEAEEGRKEVEAKLRKEKARAGAVERELDELKVGQTIRCLVFL